jgi:arylsulfatase A-like enzyme
LALAALVACGGAPRAPDIVLVLVDTLRADRLGCYGNEAGLTPFLDSFANSGVRFANAYAASAWTNPSVAALFTSRFPSQTHITGFDSALAPDEETLAERLADVGYRGVGEVANLRLTTKLGFSQGFARWKTFGDGKPRADYVVDDLRTYLDRRRRWLPWGRWRRAPLFLYLHFMEPHGPYDPPDAIRQTVAGGVDADRVADVNRRFLDYDWQSLGPEDVGLLGALYDGEVRAVDQALERLFEVLETRGVLDHAIVVVTADHGEEFREHGLLGHGTSLFEEQIRVPLLVRAPGWPNGAVVETPVSLVDVAPTLLTLAGAAPEPRFEGRSLASLVVNRGLATSSSDVLAELTSDGTVEDRAWRRHRAALIQGRSKLLVPSAAGSAPLLFDLARDPGERTPLEGPMTSALAATLAAREAALAGSARAEATRVPLDEVTRARLRALGYAH